MKILAFWSVISKWNRITLMTPKRPKKDSTRDPSTRMIMAMRRARMGMARYRFLSVRYSTSRPDPVNPGIDGRAFLDSFLRRGLLLSRPRSRRQARRPVEEVVAT
jgi:hypothetical protein